MVIKTPFGLPSPLPCRTCLTVSFDLPSIIKTVAPENTLTEIPEHLLKRSKKARGDKSDAPADTAADSKVVETPAAAAPTPAAPVEEAPPAPVAPYVAAANARKKIPWWAASALILLPLWAFAYVGTLERPPEESHGVLAEGELIYGARCASCHGATGSGGVGPAFDSGDLVTVFPDVADQIDWIVKGSDGYGSGNAYGEGRTVNGGMPGWGDVLTAEELLGVTLYERGVLGGSAKAVALAEAIDHAVAGGTIDLPEHFDPASSTVEELHELLAPLASDH